MLLGPLKLNTGVCTEERELCIPGQPINSLLSATTAVSSDIFMEKYHTLERRISHSFKGGLCELAASNLTHANVHSFTYAKSVTFCLVSATRGMF